MIRNVNDPINWFDDDMDSGPSERHAREEAAIRAADKAEREYEAEKERKRAEYYKNTVSVAAQFDRGGWRGWR